MTTEGRELGDRRVWVFVHLRRDGVFAVAICEDEVLVREAEEQQSLERRLNRPHRPHRFMQASYSRYEADLPCDIIPEVV